ncbi:MAG: group II intron reverse transcriptase/maturase [Bacteroidota bacterium]
MATPSMTENGWSPEAGMSESLSRLRGKLGRKAREESTFRFYTLYGHIHRMDTLEAAWRHVRANHGGPGIDGVTFSAIETSVDGVTGFLTRLSEELRTKTYRPQPVLRVYIDKPNGGQRPLGIPTIRDRVAQMAALLILEPIFEADFHDSSYGFRPGRSAHDGLAALRGHLQSGYRAVYDADLRACFDTIPHEKLQACLEKRISDRHMLKLIRRWLQAPVAEEETKDRKKGDPPKGGSPRYRLTKPDRGTPQGGVLSPLLANIFLHWFDVAFHRKTGPGYWAKAKLVRYADDFVICARYVSDRMERWVEQTVEDWMGLELNREKTRVVRLDEPKAHLDFLGYTYRYDRDLHGRNQRYLNVAPSKKAVAREWAQLRDLIGPRRCFQPLPDLISVVNRQVQGWARYFSYGYPRMAYRQINGCLRIRFSQHLDRRSQRPWKGSGTSSKYAYLESLGLIYL